MTSCPATTELGAASDTVRSATVATATVAIEALLVWLGSLVGLPVVTVALIVDVSGAFVTTFRVRTNRAEARVAKLSRDVHEIVPVPPTLGVVQAQSTGGITLWKVVLAGKVVVMAGVTAALDPLLVTVIASVKVWPATTFGLGARLFVMARSADVAALTPALSR